MAFIATLHRSEVAPKVFIAIEHVVVPMLVAGRDDRCWHGLIRELDRFEVLIKHLDVISSGIVIPCVSD